MKENLLIDNIKINKDLIIPNYMIQNLLKLDLNLEEFILLVYLINQSDIVPFDINKLSTNLNYESNKILELISSLNEKNYISIEMNKKNGIIEEFISLDLFYNKIISFMIDKKEEINNKSIFSNFEKEYGRTLSPTEIEIIESWKESNFSDEMILEALKEAVLSGVYNMRYIDKILFEWSKKGYKTVEDIKHKTKQKDEFEEIYDYDWLNE
jgi:DNA replication protein